MVYRFKLKLQSFDFCSDVGSFSPGLNRSQLFVAFQSMSDCDCLLLMHIDEELLLSEDVNIDASVICLENFLMFLSIGPICTQVGVRHALEIIDGFTRERSSKFIGCVVMDIARMCFYFYKTK